MTTAQNIANDIAVRFTSLDTFDVESLHDEGHGYAGGGGGGLNVDLADGTVATVWYRPEDDMIVATVDGEDFAEATVVR